MKRIGRPCGFPVSTTWRCTPPPPATLWVFIMILVSADTAADRLATPSRAAINCYWINQEPTCIKSSYTRVGRRTGLPSYIGGRFWEAMWRGGAVRRIRVTNWRRISGEIRRLTFYDLPSDLPCPNTAVERLATEPLGGDAFRSGCTRSARLEADAPCYLKCRGPPEPNT